MAAPRRARTRAIDVVVNRKRRSFTGPPFRRLIDVLREDFGLTGTKEGCGEGECGACTVLVDGVAVNSCLVPICQVEGQSIRTVESLGRPEALNALQTAFLQSGGAQCGICTPGMLMTATAWIEQGGSDDADAIREVLAGNLCRCTGYQHIVNAVAATVRDRRGTRAKKPSPTPPDPLALSRRKSEEHEGKGKGEATARTSTRESVPRASAKAAGRRKRAATRARRAAAGDATRQASAKVTSPVNARKADMRAMDTREMGARKAGMHTAGSRTTGSRKGGARKGGTRQASNRRRRT